MQDDYMEDMEEEKRPKKRRRWPFLLLGFFFGFLTTIGSLVLAVVLLINNPVKKTVGTIDTVANTDLYETLFGDEDDLGILDASYGDKSLKEAIEEISGIAQKGSALTFADLNAISPQVEKTLDNLIEMAEEKSIILDKNSLLTTPLNEFSALLMDEVKKIELGKVLLATKPEIFEDSNSGVILKNLLFGKAGVNYTEWNGTIEMLPITYTYDQDTDTFVCVDDTVYYKNGNVWREENGQYISADGENFVLRSADNREIYQLQTNVTRQTLTYTAVSMINNQPQPVKQKSLVLGSLMDKNTDPMTIIGQLELGTLLGITTKKDVEANNALLISISYGTYGVDFEYDGEDENSKIIPKQGGNPFTTISSLSDLTGIVDQLKLGDILEITEEDPTSKLLLSVKDWYISDLKNPENIKNLRLEQVIDISPDDKLLSSIGKWKIGEINADKFNSIELRDIFDVPPSDNSILATLVNKTNSDGSFWTLGDLTPENINTLKIGEVLGDISDNFYLKHLSNSTLVTLSNDINTLTVVELFKDTVHYKTDAHGNIVYENGHPVLEGTWKYLLTYNPDDSNSYDYIAPEEYAVMDMEKLIENMHNNIEIATLNELHDDGIVPHLGDGSETLNQNLIMNGLEGFAPIIATRLGITPAQNIYTMTIGDLTVLQASDYLTYLLQLIPQL